MDSNFMLLDNRAGTFLVFRKAAFSKEKAEEIAHKIPCYGEEVHSAFLREYRVPFAERKTYPGLDADPVDLKFLGNEDNTVWFIKVDTAKLAAMALEKAAPDLCGWAVRKEG